MTTLHIPHHGPPGPAMREPVPGSRLRFGAVRAPLDTDERKPSLFLMVSYLLGLASVGVVVVTGQVPWFIVPPLTVVAMIAYFRYCDERYARREARRKRHP